MSGLQRICKIYGRVQIGSEMWIWDYVQDRARLDKEMTKEEKKASEKKRWTDIGTELDKLGKSKDQF